MAASTTETLCKAALTASLSLCAAGALAAPVEPSAIEAEPLTLTGEWDKVFAQSDRVAHEKITFVNRYGITLAERGFLTIAFDPSFTGESGGKPRYVASPDINTEDFSAAVDYLATRGDVNPERIGILGICGWGGMALNAAAMDTRIKATVASTMYDMSRVNARGYFDATDEEGRHALRKTLNERRTLDYKAGRYTLAGGLPDERPAEPQFFADYWDYYKTERGYHKRSLNSNGGWNTTSSLSFINMPLLAYAGEIRSAVLLVHGEKAHSRYFSEDAFKLLKGDNKSLVIVPGANHTDLYDKKIPFDTIENFFSTYLK